MRRKWEIKVVFDDGEITTDFRTEFTEALHFAQYAEDIEGIRYVWLEPPDPVRVSYEWSNDAA